MVFYGKHGLKSLTQLKDFNLKRDIKLLIFAKPSS